MNFIHAFQEGGVFMYFILGLGLVTAVTVAERFFALYLKVKRQPDGFRINLLSLFRKGDLGAATALARSSGDGIARVIASACELRAQGAGEEELQSRVDEALSEELSRLGRRTGFLAMFGNVATLLGLLGTICGMIRSFAAVAGSNPSDRAMLLSRGISEAMNCTAFGLIVAIPALVAYAVFQNRTDQLASNLTETVTKIYHDILFSYEPSGTRSEGAR